MSCVWLDWIDHWNFILDYRLVHTWSAHTTHKSNVQWMLIPFLWLYVFKCDVYTQLLVNQIKKIFECFICFWKCFYAFVCLEFLVQNVYFRFLLKKKKKTLSEAEYTEFQISEWGLQILEYTEFQTENFVTVSRVKSTRKIYYVLQWHFHE